MDPAARVDGGARGRPLPRTVIGLGLVSLFTDISSDAIFPLLPVFLASLGASNAWIGAVEGAAELVSNVLKYVSGRLADRSRRLKPLVLAGYGLSTLIRPLMAFATGPWHVLLVRVADRVGKGVRSSPRDALIASVTSAEDRGRAFGFHRAMDHTGAAIGTLFSAVLLWWLGADAAVGADAPEALRAMRTVFLWAAIPGVIAMVALALTPEPDRPAIPTTHARHAPLPAGLKRALLPLIVFAFANATDAFLIVKAIRLGASASVAPLLWLGLHVIKASLGTWGGRLADRHGRRETLAAGWVVYAFTWAAIGFADQLPVLFVLVGLYGISHGLVEGAERALVAELAGAAKGAAFGVYNMGVGMAALVASTTFGAVWDRFGSAPAFGVFGGFALVAAVLLLALVPRAPGGRPEGAPSR